MQQMRALHQLHVELKALEAPSRNDIEIIRDRIERCERDLVCARKDAIRKEREFKNAKAMLERKEKEKVMLTEHLRLILYETERKKEQKLRELQHRLSESGGAGDGTTSP